MTPVTCGQCAEFIPCPDNPGEGMGLCASFIGYEQMILQKHGRKLRPSEFDAAQKQLDGGSKPKYPGVERRCLKFKSR